MPKHSNNYMKHLTVKLGKRSYPIFIGKHILSTKILERYICSSQVLIITNTNVGDLYLQHIQELLPEHSIDTFILPDGEEHKNLQNFEKICNHLLSNKHNRDTTLIALGGGVIGDITGFAAACYQRGVNFIQIPTSLLAQVDSSVGGKTAVNHTLGKNMIGAFYQPQAVFIDINFLQTLDRRQIVAGLAEVIKYGAIEDSIFFAWLEQHLSALLSLDEDALIHAITKSCSIKAKIVGKDENESNVRAILNFGHTLGHAIEAHQNYTGLLHGEAVGVGMLFATFISFDTESIPFKRLKKLLLAANLPTSLPSDISYKKLQKAMAIDKKVFNHKLQWILLKKLGSAYISDSISNEFVENKILEFMSV